MPDGKASVDRNPWTGDRPSHNDVDSEVATPQVEDEEELEAKRNQTDEDDEVEEQEEE